MTVQRAHLCTLAVWVPAGPARGGSCRSGFASPPGLPRAGAPQAVAAPFPPTSVREPATALHSFASPFAAAAAHRLRRPPRPIGQCRQSWSLRSSRLSPKAPQRRRRLRRRRLPVNRTHRARRPRRRLATRIATLSPQRNRPWAINGALSDGVERLLEFLP